MTRSQRITLAGVGWVLCATALFLSLGTRSLAGWSILAVAGFVPPLVYAALSGGPPITIAEVLYNAEAERPRK
jgi:hypothetical protein